MEVIKCPTCGGQDVEVLSNGVFKCKQCNAVFQSNQPQTTVIHNVVDPVYRSKSKVVAGLLAIFLGGLGIHKFYLGRVGAGIFCILFCWTGIPEIVGLIEGIVYLCKSDYAFNEKYCRIR